MQHDSQTPILSLVMPTRNRQSYALSAVSALLTMPDDDVEIVVQDSSDAVGLGEALTKLDDGRVRYAHAGSPCSSLENFNRALGLARGEYVCLLGDDDGVNPEIVAAARWAAAHSVDALRPENRLNYLWPDVAVYSRLRHAAGTLTIAPLSGQSSYPDQEECLLACLRTGAQNYLDLGLPKLYHGLVRRELTLEVKRRCGAFFKGVSPDIFASFALAALAPTVLRLDYPLAIPGACGLSASAENTAGRTRGPLQSAPHFRGIENYEWSRQIPAFYSGETIWADSAVAALVAVGRDDLVRKLNLPALTARCVAAHPRFAHEFLTRTYEILDGEGVGVVTTTRLLLHEIARGPAREFVGRAWRRLTGAAQLDYTVVRHLPDIGAAMRALERHLASNGRSFARCVA